MSVINFLPTGNYIYHLLNITNPCIVLQMVKVCFVRCLL